MNTSSAQKSSSQAYLALAITPEKCRDCPELNICGAGCPLELKAKRILCGECYES